MRFNQFEHKLQEIRSDSLDDFAEKVALKLKENIEDLWYNQYTPEDYDRTYQLLDSVDIKTTKAGRQVYINEDSIPNGDRQGGRGWTEHIGVTGERVDSFADMLSENAIGNPQGKNKRANAGITNTDFWEATNEWVDNNMRDEIMNYVVAELGRNNIRARVTTGKVANVKGNLQSGIRIKI